jgi:hypothetical protein
MTVIEQQDYAIFDAVGRITTAVRCHPDMAVHQPIPEGGGILESSGENWETHYILDGQVVVLPLRTGAEHQFDFTNQVWFDPRSLDELKAHKWSEVKRARDAAEFGGFTVEGNTFDSNQISQQRIGQAAQHAMFALSANLPYSQAWTLADNTEIELDAQQMIAVALAMGECIGNAHAQARVLRAQIHAANSIEDLALVAEWE